MNDLENNIGEIKNLADRSFLLFYLNLFKKKNIILDNEKQPLLPKTPQLVLYEWI
jgi:transcriptional regulator with AAA-type ATPase domain